MKRRFQYTMHQNKSICNMHQYANDLLAVWWLKKRMQLLCFEMFRVDFKWTNGCKWFDLAAWMVRSCSMDGPKRSSRQSRFNNKSYTTELLGVNEFKSPNKKKSDC